MESIPREEAKNSGRVHISSLLRGLLTIAGLAAIGFISFDLLSNKDMDGAPPVTSPSDYILPSRTGSSIEVESIQDKQSLNHTRPVIDDTRDIEK